MRISDPNKLVGKVMEIKTQRPDDDVRFDKSDIAAVANSRFFRKSGLKMLVIFAAIMLAIVSITNYISAVPVFVGYGALAVCSLVFVYLYGKKQTEIRVKLWERIESDRLRKQKESEDKAQR